VNGEDILFAMTSLGFENYAEALKIYLSKYREVRMQPPSAPVTRPSFLTSYRSSLSPIGERTRTGPRVRATELQVVPLRDPARFPEPNSRRKAQTPPLTDYMARRRRTTARQVNTRLISATGLRAFITSYLPGIARYTAAGFG
jgi:hypothetical protein